MPRSHWVVATATVSLPMWTPPFICIKPIHDDTFAIATAMWTPPFDCIKPIYWQRYRCRCRHSVWTNFKKFSFALGRSISDFRFEITGLSSRIETSHKQKGQWCDKALPSIFSLEMVHCILFWVSKINEKKIFLNQHVLKLAIKNKATVSLKNVFCNRSVLFSN